MDLSNHIPLLAYCRQHGYSSRTARDAATAGKIKGAVKVPANSPVGQWLVPADCDWTPKPAGAMPEDQRRAARVESTRRWRERKRKDKVKR